MNIPTDEDIHQAIEEVISTLTGINNLYESQYKILSYLMQDEDIFFTSSTNSGKTLPTVIFPLILKKLHTRGFPYPECPKILYLTPLNSLQLSLVHNVTTLGIDCKVVTPENVKELLSSSTQVLFISPETLKMKSVSQELLKCRRAFVLKVVDEAHLG